MAVHVWTEYKANDSRACRGCHAFSTEVLAKQPEMVQPSTRRCSRATRPASTATKGSGMRRPDHSASESSWTDASLVPGRRRIWPQRSCSAAMPRSTKQHSRTSRHSRPKAFQYSVVDPARSSPVEIEETDQEILDADDPQSKHWRGLQPDPTDRLLIRRPWFEPRSGSQQNQRVTSQPQPFFYLRYWRAAPPAARFTPTHCDSATVLGPSTERRDPPRGGLPRRRVRSYVRLRSVAPKIKHSPLATPLLTFSEQR